MNPLPFDYTIIPNPRRRRIAICVTPDGRVIVRTPPRTSKKSVDSMLRRNTPWVLDTISRSQARIDNQWQWQPGGMMPLLGKAVPVYIAGDSRARIQDGAILLSQNPDQWVQSGIEAYRAFALQYMSRLVAQFAPIVGVMPAGIKIGGAARSWGCCKKDGVIRFSWRLVCMNPDFIEYVAVHELCHLRHFDHSPAFWDAVASVMPDWKQRRKLPEVGNIAAWLESVVPAGGQKGLHHD